MFKIVRAIKRTYARKTGRVINIAGTPYYARRRK